jgi:hypothetical protein
VKRRNDRKERWQADFDNEHLMPRKGWEYLGVPPYQARFWAYSQENLTLRKEAASFGIHIIGSTTLPRLQLVSLPSICRQAGSMKSTSTFGTLRKRIDGRSRSIAT